MIIDIPCISWEFKYILRMVSLWPNTYNVPVFIALWTSLITVVPFQLIDVTRISDNIGELMAAICDIFDEVALFSKLLIALINREILWTLIIEMNEDWKESEIKVTRETRLSCLVSRLDLYVYCGGMTILWPKLIISYITDIPENREFFVKISYPFNGYISPFYETLVITQFLQGSLMATADLVPQALVVALVCHSGVQSDILQQQIEEFIIMAKDCSITHGNILLMVADVIKKHQKNINFAERIEKVFSLISLIHCLCNGFSIGCSGLVFIMSRDIHDIGRFMFYIVMKLIQTFMLCYAGEHLTNKSLMVANKIFECNWYDLNPKYVKILHVMILRAQKPSQITTGKFSVLSIEMFTVILQAAVSYMSVLRATYGN